jgi:hypothetical protein
MSDWRYERENRHDVVKIPLVWFAYLLSLLVHIAALWYVVPRLRPLSLLGRNPRSRRATWSMPGCRRRRFIWAMIRRRYGGRAALCGP